MVSVRQYVLSVVSMAVICGIAQMLIPGDHTLTKFVAGVMLVMTAAGPFVRGGGLSVDLFLEQISSESDWAVREGVQVSRETMSSLIIQKAESYILNRAEELGAAITVEVKLDKEKHCIPNEARVKGTVSPYAKKQLADYMEQELGISGEKQIWIS